MKKKANLESEGSIGKSFEQIETEKDVINISNDDKVTENPTKIKIAVKTKQKRLSVPYVSSTQSPAKRKVDDDETDIFDDLQVKKINVIDEDISSSNSSTNDKIVKSETGSVKVLEKKNLCIVSTDTSSTENIENNLCSTPKQKLLSKNNDSNKVCSPAVLEDRKHRMKVEIAKLLVKINERKDDLEKYVERQEFLLAQEMKTTITTLEAEKLKLSSVLERGDGSEIKEALDQRYKNIGSTQMIHTPKSTNQNTNITKTPISVSTNLKPSVGKEDKVNVASNAKSSSKKLTPKRIEIMKDKEKRAKAKEEEKIAKELEKRQKEETKEKERIERNIQKEKEKKEKEEQKERERKDKELQKERERIEKLDQKQNERIEKEKNRLAKEEEKIRRQLDKELEKEELKKERELEKLKKDQEKERIKKEKEEEKERLEKIEKEKQDKIAKAFTSFFTKKRLENDTADGNGVPSTTGSNVRSEEPLDASTKYGVLLENNKHRNNHLSQFIIKKNMKIAPITRLSIESASKRKLDHILEMSNWEETQNTYIQILKSGQYVSSKSGHTWPIQDVVKAQGATEGEADCEGQINDDEEEAEDQTVASLLELDQSKIVEIDIPDENLATEMNKINTASSNGDGKSSNLFCTTKAKLLQFHENERPPYWGTWSRKSDVIGPRRPFAKDCHFLEYDYDSDEDWEEEEEGESLSDEEKDKEEEEMKEDDDDDDGFFVGHGVLDKDEAHLIDSDEDDDISETIKKADTSTENIKPQLEEDLEIQKMKMRADQFEEEYKKQKQMPKKLKPRVFGCFWNNASNNQSSISDTGNKDKIVHEQLMKILQPNACVVLLRDDDNENGNFSDGPIDTSHTINIRVCYFF